MRVTNANNYNTLDVIGDDPSVIHSDGTRRGIPDTSRFFKRRKIGSLYRRQLTANHSEVWEKIKNDGRADDWVCTEGRILQYLQKSDFTDGGGATGTKSLNGTIPEGAYFEKTLLYNVVDFVGSAAVTIQIGEAGDVDRYNTGTPSLAATDNSVDVGEPSGTKYHDAATTPVVTITDDSDFGDLTSGSMVVALFYRGNAGV